MTPLQIFNEDAAELVREWLNTHWHVWIMLAVVVSAFAAGFFIGRQER